MELDIYVFWLTNSSLNIFVSDLVWFSLWCLTPLSTIFQFIVAVSFIGGGNRSTRKKQPNCRKSPTNFIT